MKINTINNSEYRPQHFGHSFRVSISLKHPNGCEDIFINPYTNRKLYRSLNSKIIGWLNGEYRENIRQVFGIKRKTPKPQLLGGMQKRMTEELKRLDSDYAFWGFTRSLYRKSKLGYIVTGVDASIIENIKGIKDIGITRAQESWGKKAEAPRMLAGITKLAQKEALKYVQDSNVILRSKNNREIMLKVLFHETGKYKNGNPIYEIYGFEFHEIMGKPPLPPVRKGFEQNKYNPQMLEEVKHSIESHATKTAGDNILLENIDPFVNLH